jgi:Ca2+-dependent lipid-binding protein
MHTTEKTSLVTPFFVFALPSSVVSFINSTPFSLAILFMIVIHIIALYKRIVNTENFRESCRPP